MARKIQYGVLNPGTASLQYANAGHTLLYRLHQAGAEELSATGMSLGLMSGMTYEVKETVIAVDERLLLVSDGLGEARDTAGVITSQCLTCSQDCPPGRPGRKIMIQEGCQ